MIVNLLIAYILLSTAAFGIALSTLFIRVERYKEMCDDNAKCTTHYIQEVSLYSDESKNLIDTLFQMSKLVDIHSTTLESLLVQADRMRSDIDILSVSRVAPEKDDIVDILGVLEDDYDAEISYSGCDENATTISIKVPITPEICMLFKGGFGVDHSHCGPDICPLLNKEGGND